MAKVNWLDRISYPQYEQGGRFNLLSLFQLPYAFTKGGTEEIERRKGLTQRGEDVAVAGPEADVSYRQALGQEASARTGLLKSQQSGVEQETLGRGINNEASRLAFNEAKNKADREASARKYLMGSLDQYMGSQVPADLPQEAVGEFLNLYGGATDLSRQQETGDMRMDQNRKLYEQGDFAMTPEAQFAQQKEIEKQKLSAQTVESEQRTSSAERQNSQNQFASVAGHAMSSGQFDAQKPFLRSYAKSLGLGDTFFPPSEVSPAEAIDAEAQRRRQEGTKKSTEKRTEKSTEVPKVASSAQNVGKSSGGLFMDRSFTNPKAVMYERLDKLLPKGLRSGGVQRFMSETRGYTDRQLEELRQMMEQISEGKQYSGFAGSIPGPGIEMPQIQEILEMVRQLQEKSFSPSPVKK